MHQQLLYRPFYAVLLSIHLFQQAFQLNFLILLNFQVQHNLYLFFSWFYIIPNLVAISIAGFFTFSLTYAYFLFNFVKVLTLSTLTPKASSISFFISNFFFLMSVSNTKVLFSSINLTAFSVVTGIILIFNPLIYFWRTLHKPNFRRKFSKVLLREF